MKQRVGLYPGTFDPMTLGHVDIISRGAKLVDKLVIAVAINRDKGPLFTVEERVEMVRDELADVDMDGCEIEIRPFENLLVQLADECHADIIIRGLRGVVDFEYEYQMVGMNGIMNPNVETVFLMANHKYQMVASRLVKEIARMGGEIDAFVSPTMAKIMYEKLGAAKS